MVSPPFSRLRLEKESHTERPKLIKQGDRVKLTARAAATFDNRRGGKSVWTDRRVLRIATNRANAVVLWDGRMSMEYLPIRAIEFAASLASIRTPQ
jgi:hypothetical protein